jgi:hypothetical protein
LDTAVAALLVSFSNVRVFLHAEAVLARRGHEAVAVERLRWERREVR